MTFKSPIRPAIAALEPSGISKVTALGLGMTFTSAVRDELVEHLLGIDPAGELVMGCAVIGNKP